MPSVNYSINHKQEMITTNTKDRLGVTALVAIMEPATGSQFARAYKQPMRSRPKFEELFSGKLGDWDCKPVSLQLKEGAQPYHGRPFPIPKKHIEITKREVQRLCDLGVLKWQDDSEWASPTFIIPKKDNTVRVVSDFREVNKRIVRKPFPIPKISTVLQELEGFTYATALDLNMGYYTIRLDPDASKICTIIFPW
eukprot:CCRYP_019628-RA/>CCRYP_019628-RA protein AED:0.81 eAED:0.81 QI:0/0/0/0.5/0/0/2/0/195